MAKSNDYISVNDRAFVYERDGYLCQNPRCKHWSKHAASADERKPFLTIHHCEFFAEGGANEPWNFVTLCVVCHRSIHNHRNRQLEGLCRSMAIARARPGRPVWKDMTYFFAIRQIIKHTWRSLLLTAQTA